MCKKFIFIILILGILSSGASGQSSVATTPSSKLTQMDLDELDIKDLPILDALKIISEKTGLNIIAGEDVTGKITIYLKNVSVAEALRIVLQSNGLAYVEEGSIIRVMTAEDFDREFGYSFGQKIQTRIISLLYVNGQDIVPVLTQMKSKLGKVIFDEKSKSLIIVDTPEAINALEGVVKQLDVPLETRVFYLRYAKASDLVEKIKSVVSPNIGQISFDEKLNNLKITDTVLKMKEIDRIVRALDAQEQREIVIEPKTVEILLNDEHRSGVDWEAIVSDYKSFSLNPLQKSDSSANEMWSQRKLSLGTVSNEDYEILLEALDAVGLVQMTPLPSVKILDNREGKVIAESANSNLTNKSAASSNPGKNKTSFFDGTVKLNIIPKMQADGSILLKIKPKVNMIAPTPAGVKPGSFRNISGAEGEIEIFVREGETVVLGGLLKEEKTQSIRKIPLLGDIPILGFAFRNEDRRIETSEAVIFLTPKVILEKDKEKGSGVK